MVKVTTYVSVLESQLISTGKHEHKLGAILRTVGHNTGPREWSRGYRRGSPLAADLPYGSGKLKLCKF